MQKISPFLWFENQAEEAANFYTSIFPNSKIRDAMRYGDAGPGPKGSVMSVTFELEGQEFLALNGGPDVPLLAGDLFFVKCATQEEVDHCWNRLSAGGTPQQCGWLQDKYGISWQIVPNALGEMLQDKDRAKSKRVMEAMLKMVKLDIAGLKAAYDQR